MSCGRQAGNYWADALHVLEICHAGSCYTSVASHAEAGMSSEPCMSRGTNFTEKAPKPCAACVPRVDRGAEMV